MIDRVVALTATEPPHEATHWTSAAMARVCNDNFDGLRATIGMTGLWVSAGPVQRGNVN